MPSTSFTSRARVRSNPSDDGTPLDLGTLYSLHADAVARWAMRLQGPGIDVEDVVHEVFLVACRRLAEFRGEAKVTTWLYEITVRVVQDRRRRARRWSWLFDRGTGTRSPLTDGQSPHDEIGRVPAEQPSALELLERKEASVQLYQILDGLPETYRTTLILFELEGVSGQEIAAITKTSVANVWIRLFRGRRQFTKRLRAREKEQAAKGRTP